MDIIIHIMMLVLIGLFFFLDKHNAQSSNAIFVIILLSFIGFLFVQSGTIEIVDYTAVEKVNSTYWQHPQTDITNNGFGIMDVQSFFVLVYWFFMIMGSIILIQGKKDFEKGSIE